MALCLLAPVVLFCGLVSTSRTADQFDPTVEKAGWLAVAIGWVGFAVPPLAVMPLAIRLRPRQRH